MRFLLRAAALLLMPVAAYASEPEAPVDEDSEALAEEADAIDDNEDVDETEDDVDLRDGPSKGPSKGPAKGPSKGPSKGKCSSSPGPASPAPLAVLALGVLVARRRQRGGRA